MDDNTTPHQIEALKLFVSETTMVHAYQMLLLLVMLSQADEGGRFSLQIAAARFTRFYAAQNQDLIKQKARAWVRRLVGYKAGNR